MEWGYALLALAGCLSGGISQYLYQKTDRKKFVGLLFASGFFILVNVAAIFRPIAEGETLNFIIRQTINWGQIICLAFVLSALLLFVRRSKPEFSRFPVSYTIFPLLIILSYLLVLNTVVLKDWLLNIYQAGAVAVALLIYGIYSYRNRVYLTTFAGSILFFLTFILHLTLPARYLVVMQIALALSITTIFLGYYIADRHYETQI